MAISLFIFLFPRIHEEVVLSFATSALVTGIALITTGFIQGQRQEIAYYQQAIIVQMAGMGFGPAALAWLKRGHGRPDTVFFTFTILYVIIMASYLFYTVGQGSSNGPIINCFLDDVPSLYGKHGIRIVNSIVVSVSIPVILASIGANWYINNRYHNGSNNYSRRRPLNTWVVLLMFLVVLGAETVLAASVEKTIMEYSQFATPDSRTALQAWQFGQIIPFFLLLQPVLEALRAMLPKIVFKHKARKAAKQARGEVRVGEEAVETTERKQSPKDTSDVDEAEQVEYKNLARANTSEAREELA
jgi:hypothetical protein